MLKITGLGHINVVVESITEGINYYKNLFECTPLQIFPHFRNKGFSFSAGFVENSEDIDVTICFVQIPETDITLELMEYHTPKGNYNRTQKKTNDIGNVGHICLKVKNIDYAFEHIKTIPDTKLISSHDDYHPHKISPINVTSFTFFDESKNNNTIEKQTVCNIIKEIRYFYFIDKYGIQWEFEEGHDDIGQ
ncbi:VOC family protein [Mixta mediterraneensis]|uniref:VOC family protein n=1 Tax=Mixta mediterraneensis TaxID=2758443 RepID=UPI001873CA67|nr:VOC family protein [Mixta mediterraneensis]MBE5254429.1 VOC family protein [Mixta mediterraneensis]